MTKKEFKELCEKKIVLLDGATGTELQKLNMPTGVCPEKWILDNPNSIISIQEKYINNGSDIVYAATFGANRYKLKSFGIDDVKGTNKDLVLLSKKAVLLSGKKAFIAGDLAPTGKLIEPLGDAQFEEVVDVYKEQVEGLLLGGVDLFVVETMLNVQEARAAVIAIKESCDLPIMVTVTFEENGKTLTGVDPKTALITLQSLGIDAFGVNCSSGPDKMVGYIKEMHEYANIPLIAKPNAGIPELINGKTVFNMGSDEFASFADKLIESGANILGGCCGTNDDFISKVYNITKNIVPEKIDKTKGLGIICSGKKILDLNNTNKTIVIGERINPTGKPELQESLLNEDYDEVIDFAEDQEECGADIIDINLGMAGIDEKEAIGQVINALAFSLSLPIALDTLNWESLERGLRLYQGRAIVNSISLQKNRLSKFLEIAKFYGAVIIAMPLNDNGLPKNLDERKENIIELLKEANNVGIDNKDIIIDGLVLPIAGNKTAAKNTLDTVRWCNDSMNVKTVIGLSNISFGMPKRSLLNASFISNCVLNGLSMAILNPSQDNVIDAMKSAEVLVGIDEDGLEFVKKNK